MSDRHPEWREHPDYQDWPDHQGEAGSDQGNGRRRADPPPRRRPDPGQPGRRAGPAGQEQPGGAWYQESPPDRPDGPWTAPRWPEADQPGAGWSGGTGQPAGPPWPGPAGQAGQPGGWRDPRDQSGPGWRDPGQPGGDAGAGEPPELEWRHAASEPGQPGGRRPDPPGQWREAGRRPAEPGAPAPAGKHDSGRVVPGRAQRNSGRITGRLTRRTQRGGRPEPRRDPAAATEARAPRPEAPPPGPVPRPAWPVEERGSGPTWSPEAAGRAPAPDAPRPAPPRPGGGSGEAPAPGVRRPTPPHAWAPSDRPQPPRFPEPRPPQRHQPAPGHGQDHGEAWRHTEAAGPGRPGQPGRGAPPWAGHDEELARPEPAGYHDAAGAEDQEIDAAAAPSWHGPEALGTPARVRGGAHGRARTRKLPGMPKLRGPRIPQASLALAGIAILVAAGLAGLIRTLPEASAPAPAEAGAPYSARWICPLLPGSTGTVVADNLGQRPAAMRVGVNAVRSQGVAGPGGQALPDLAAGASRTVRAQAGPNGGFVQLEAFGAPIAVTSAGQPPCVPGPATRWWLPSLTLTNETKASLVIANPETADATVNVTPHVSQGSLHPKPLQNIFVKAGTTVRKDLDVPELPGLPFTAEVVASQGRVVVGTRMDSRIGDRQERLIVPAQPTERSSWLFSGVTGGVAGDIRQVDLLVTNPNPKALSLVVEGTNDQGPFKVPGFDLPVTDGAINEVLVPVNIGKSGAFSLRVRSKDGARFVAAVRFGSGAGLINARYLDLGGTGLDARWMAPTVPASRRLVLANSTSAPLTATLSALSTPADAASTQAGPGAPVTIQPGQVRIVNVPKGLQDLLVVADGPGLVAAPVGEGQLVPGSQVGGVPLSGAVTPGPAAAP